MTNVGIALAVPGALAWACIAILLRTRWRNRLADHPNERSLHSVPTPRIGGIGILVGVAPIAAACATGPLAFVAACALLLWTVSLADDIRSLPVKVRLGAHALAAATALVALVGVPREWDSLLLWLLAFIAIAWTTNLYNFMDGTDGLAGGMAAIGFGCYGIGAWLAGEMALACLCVALSSASVGFLAHNFPPARVFLGDSGSIPLGFLAGALGAYGVVAQSWPPFFPLLVFSPFIVDATVTLLRRIARGEPVWRAHRGHNYQRLVLSGWSRRRLLAGAYALMLCGGASALASRSEGAMLQCGIILAWSSAYAWMLHAIDRKTTTSSRAAP